MTPTDEQYREWVVSERARMRQVMCQRRARRRAQLSGEPDYPDVVREAMARWVDARRASGFAEAELAEVVHYMRRAIRLIEPTLYDCIQDRGTAKMLRAMGFELRRSAQGMVVLGLKV